MSLKSFSLIHNQQFELLIAKILKKEQINNTKSKAKIIIASYEGKLIIYHLNQNKNQFKEIYRKCRRECN